ncbi:MAG: hypothetical protein ACOZDY_12775 [Pseudomonadota bacterium]
MIRLELETILRPVELPCDRYGRVIPQSACVEWNETLQFGFTGRIACHFGLGLFVPA